MGNFRLLLRRLRNFFVAIGNGMLPAYYRAARLWLQKQDPWQEVRHPVPFRLFGVGSRHEFSWYLEGQCQVAVTSIEDMEDWLLKCSYLSDARLFNDVDFWQHPAMFEKVRKGDCEDHAIWVWRRLRDLGIPAKFFCGRVISLVNGGAGFHAWVVYEHEGKPVLFESVAYHRARMLRPLDEARHEYIPHFSVDHTLSTSLYCGFAHSGSVLNRRARERADHLSQA